MQRKLAMYLAYDATVSRWVALIYAKQLPYCFAMNNWGQH